MFHLGRSFFKKLRPKTIYGKVQGKGKGLHFYLPPGANRQNLQSVFHLVSS